MTYHPLQLKSALVGGTAMIAIILWGLLNLESPEAYQPDPATHFLTFACTGFFEAMIVGRMGYEIIQISEPQHYELLADGVVLRVGDCQGA